MSIFSKIFPSNTSVRRKLKNQFLEDYVKNYYCEDSINKKKFYNVGAGNQRSRFDFWSYIDLESSKYNKDGVDVFFDLESLKEIPLPSDEAEVIFNSFVIEHITKEATKNLCKEAYRTLKKGGIFHSKVHCYNYGYKLLSKKLISPNTPFNVRESSKDILNFIKKNNRKVRAYFNNENYIIESLQNPSDKIIFTPGDSFLYHNATAAVNNVKAISEPTKLLLSLMDEKNNIQEFYDTINKTFVDQSKKQPHQHNADYFPKEELYDFLKKIGFSEVYFVQPYQSLSPALWEDNLNPIHNGFLFSIEAIK